MRRGLREDSHDGSGLGVVKAHGGDASDIAQAGDELRQLLCGCDGAGVVDADSDEDGPVGARPGSADTSFWTSKESHG